MVVLDQLYSFTVYILLLHTSRHKRTHWEYRASAGLDKTFKPNKRLHFYLTDFGTHPHLVLTLAFLFVDICPKITVSSRVVAFVVCGHLYLSCKHTWWDQRPYSWVWGRQPQLGTTTGSTARAISVWRIVQRWAFVIRGVYVLGSALCDHYCCFESVRLLILCSLILPVPATQPVNRTCPLQQQPILATPHQMEAGAGLSSSALSSP